MQGTITVESNHYEIEEVQPGETGSTFTISIPVQSITNAENNSFNTRPKIAIFRNGSERAIEGLQIAWEKFGFDVVLVDHFADLADIDWKYIWADMSFLAQNQACLQSLLEQDKWLVLVSYDTLHTPQQIPGLVSAPQFVFLPRPLIWHSFMQRIAAAGKDQAKPEVSRIVRFASKVDLVDQNGDSKKQKLSDKDLLVMLVEDNPVSTVFLHFYYWHLTYSSQINQKLGQKMLLSLGYKVKIADNGQAAVDAISQNDLNIDAILMDQSMPLKDGVTATKEIREMEVNGVLSRRHPIIAVTAVVSSQAQAAFKDAGADDFLAKPLSLAKLERTLSIHLPAR